MKCKHRRPESNQSFASGFTLVEMLVAVALVLLMMTMFTSIFQMATNSVSKQRVIAETDQRSRSLTTILRADFAKRSMRTCFPFLPNENTATSIVPFGGRGGYVYICCNDPASGQDDIIQFSVDARLVGTNPDTSLYYGAAALLWDKIAENASASTNTALQYNPNQPEADEGDMSPNGASGSNGAEISLFLRGGSLIRRVMLLREPLPVSGEDLEIQPKSGLENPYFLTTSNSQSGSGLPEFYLAAAPTVVQSDFWKYFDFSAVPANMGNSPTGVTFIGLDALANDGAASVTSLGQPRFRFGFNPVTGLSREHESTSAAAQFIGRYLQAETSADFTGEDFNWPLLSSSIGNPLDVTNAVTLNSGTGLLNEFDGPFGRGGLRRVEDVLMSNVREFRIELWDSRLERWVVPGHSMTRVYNDAGTPRTVSGDYHITRNAQFFSGLNKFTYGPLQIPGTLSGTPHVFDTWHPQARRNFADGNAATGIAEHQAPYYPLKYYPPRQDNTTTPGPSSIAMQDPAAEYDPIAKRINANQGFWEAGRAYNVDDIVFADRPGTPTGWDADGDGNFHWDDDTTFAATATVPRQSVHVAYRCVGTTTGATNGTSSTTTPGWQSSGLRFVDNDLIWEGFNNFNPLRSVRLTIRFMEPNSETPKQLTLIMPMTDEDR